MASHLQTFIHTDTISNEHLTSIWHKECNNLVKMHIFIYLNGKKSVVVWMFKMTLVENTMTERVQ